MFRVCKLNGDGTVSVTTPADDSLAGATAYAAEHGGEVVSAAVVVALQGRGKPAGGGVPVGEFRKRLIKLRIRLAMHPDAGVRGKWGVVLPELDHFTTVYPAEQPVSELIQMAVADGLLSEAEAAALSAP